MPGAAVDERDLVPVDCAVWQAGDPELNDRVDASVWLCALSDCAKAATKGRRPASRA
jgi:hypothetical protein